MFGPPTVDSAGYPQRVPGPPVARRVEMHYDPATERAKFRIRWEGIYQPAETDVQVYPAKSLIVPWLQFAFRLNGGITRRASLPFLDEREHPSYQGIAIRP